MVAGFCLKSSFSPDVSRISRIGSTREFNIFWAALTRLLSHKHRLSNEFSHWIPYIIIYWRYVERNVSAMLQLILHSNVEFTPFQLHMPECGVLILQLQIDGNKNKYGSIDIWIIIYLNKKRRRRNYEYERSTFISIWPKWMRIRIKFFNQLTPWWSLIYDPVTEESVSFDS